MATPKRKKNAAAAAMSRLAHAAMTPEQRKGRARKAAAERWRKGKPAPPLQAARWFGVCLIPIPEDIHGGMRAVAKILDEAHAKPNVVLWTRDRDEARARARQENLAGKFAEVLDVDYDPTRFTIQREYAPDAGRQIKALRAVLDTEAGGQP